MILAILLVLIVLAVIFTIPTLIIDDLPAKMLCNMVSVIAWLSAAVGSTTVEIPYSSGNSVEIFVRTNPGVVWFLLGIGVLMIIYGWHTLTSRGVSNVSTS